MVCNAANRAQSELERRKVFEAVEASLPVNLFVTKFVNHFTFCLHLDGLFQRLHPIFRLSIVFKLTNHVNPINFAHRDGYINQTGKYPITHDPTHRESENQLLS
jgi:hypothetical protein